MSGDDYVKHIEGRRKMRSNDHETRFCSSVGGGGLRRRIYSRLRPRRPWACGRVCKPWRPRARSYHSPGITGTADAHFRKPDSGPTRGTFAAARDQRPVGAKPLWRGYGSAPAPARWTTLPSIAYRPAATLASPGLLLILLLAGSNLFMRFVTKQRRMPRYQRPR